MRLPLLPTGQPAELVQAWLLRFSCDYWYRDRYKLPLFGPGHKATDLRAIRAEFEEENLVRRLRAAPPAPARPRTPDDWAALPLLKPPGTVSVAATPAELDAELRDLDLDQFNDVPLPPPLPPESA